MHICFNLNELNELKDYPRRELSVALIIESELKELLRNAQLKQSPEVFLLQQQINFISGEINLLKEKEQLLSNIYEQLYDSVRKSDNEFKDVIQLLKETEYN